MYEVQAAVIVVATDEGARQVGTDGAGMLGGLGALFGDGYLLTVEEFTAKKRQSSD